MARNRTSAAIGVLTLGLAAAVALAGGSIPIKPLALSPSVLFLDEFEDGGLTAGDVPPGQWDGLIDRPGIDAGVSAFAAHAGNRGLRIDDRTDLPAAGITAAPIVALSPGTGDRYLRAWVRIPDTNDAGAVTIMQLLHGPRSVVDVTVTVTPSSPGVLAVAAETTDGGYSVMPPGSFLGSFWRLVEVGLIDAGTDSVTQVLWVDGFRSGQHTVNQLGWTTDELDVGEPRVADGTFQGIIDFDGVAVTSDPPPSHVVVALDAGFDGGVIAGQCQGFSAQLLSSSGTPAGSLRSDTLYLIVDGGIAQATTFTDPGCLVAGSSLDIDAGTTQVGFGIMGLTLGPLLVAVGTTDLRADLLFLTVQSSDGGTFGGDGGTDGGFDGGFDGGLPPEDGGTGDGGNTMTNPDGGGTTGGDGGTGNLETDGGIDGGDGGNGSGADAGADAGADGGADGGNQPPPPPPGCGCGAGSGPWNGIGMIALLALALARRRERPGLH